MSANILGTRHIHGRQCSGDSSESRLLGQLRKGDPDAFEQISHQYRDRLYRHAVRILKNVQDAEDAVQDALLLSFVKIETFAARSSIYTWLTSILVNCCFMQIRKKRKTAFVSLDEVRAFGSISWSETLTSGAPGIDEVLLLDEQVAVLRHEVGRLRMDHNFILTARYQDDVPLAEIASQLGLTVSATKSRAARAKKVCARNIRLRVGAGMSRIHASGAQLQV